MGRVMAVLERRGARVCWSRMGLVREVTAMVVVMSAGSARSARCAVSKTERRALEFSTVCCSCRRKEFSRCG